MLRANSADQACDTAHRTLQPDRHLETSIPEEHDEAIGSQRDLADRARTSRDHGGVVHRDRRALGDRPARELRPVREEPLAALAGLRPCVDLAERRGERREPSTEIPGEPLDVVRPPGGDGVVHLRGHPSDHAVHHLAPGCHVDADREVAGQDVLRSGGVRRPRGHVDRLPRGELNVEGTALVLFRRCMHLPVLAAERLQDEDVVRVLV